MVWIVGFYPWLFIMVKYMRVLGVACLGCIKLGSSNVGVMSWT